MTSQKSSETFHQAMTKLLERNINMMFKNENLIGKDLDKTACIRVYQTIFETTIELIQAGNIEISNESVNYLAQQYYDGALLNNGHELDPSIFSQRAKLDGVPTNELALLSVLLKGTDFMIPVVKMLKQRN